MKTHGVSFFGLLGLLFIALKLCAVIDWSWWLVLLPLYFWPALFLAIVAGVLVAVLLVYVCTGTVPKWGRK